MQPANWTSEFSRAYKSVDELYAFLGWDLSADIKKVAATYPLFVPRRLASKIKAQGPEGVLAREFLPHHLEMRADLLALGLEDPIGDKEFHKAPQLIHRYPSRALFTGTNVCPVHCRYCFRKNELNQKDEIFAPEFELTLKYLKEHPEISEIIFTGGDPFTLSNEKLDFYLTAFAKISTIKDIRFHTRYPVILPERIDSGLLKVLRESAKNFRTVSVGIHSNHVSEFDEEAKAAIGALKTLPIQLLSQSVLLKGINNNLETLIELMTLFLDLGIRPYYLHHPDRVRGGMHFYAPLTEGRKLYAALRQNLPGWAIPHYVIDLPGGHGKISAFNPESQDYSGQFLSQNGASILVPEPNISL